MQGVALQVELLPCVNRAMVDNHVVMCNRCAIVNTTQVLLHQVKVTIGGQHVEQRSVDISQLQPQWTVQLTGLQVVIDREVLTGLTDPIKTSVSFVAQCGDDIIAQTECELTLMPDNYWAGLEVMPSVLATMVLPASSATDQVLSRASQHLGQLTQDPVFDNYQTLDPNRVRAQMAAIYQAMQQMAFTALPIAKNLNHYHDKVRSPRQVVDQRMGNCLELALLMASCLEACHLNALLIIFRSHVMVGMWLVDSYSVNPVSDDSAFLVKAAHEDLAEMALLDVVACTETRPVAFDVAAQRAELMLRDPKNDFNCFVDIKSCRLQNITPSDVVTAGEAPTAQGDQPIGVEGESPDIKQVAPIDVGESPTVNITKQQIWERKLLDFSLRNNLLNMRIGKRVLPFISFAIDQLEDHISQGEDYSILPSPAQNRILPDEHGIFDSALVRDEWQELVINELKNKRLRSYLSETETINVLKFIHRSSRTALEENGANSLFLALGILKWYETDRSTKPRYAPILMIPVDLVRHSGQQYVIRSRDEETIINVTLIEMIKQQFQLPMAGLTPLPTDHAGVDVRQVMARMRQCIMSRQRWDVLDEAMLGLFSFSKFVMWNDIHNNADMLAQHPVIRALASNEVMHRDDNDEPPVDARELDLTTSPTDFAIPVDVDSSQFEAIVESGQGKSFVLHGPPGTGKSQTITNMIANALFQGKRVLFVAEKMAALEVVQKRLMAIGINRFCLELHSNKATKKHVLEQLEIALNTIERGQSLEYEKAAKKLELEREKLSHYVLAMHDKRPSGLSLYECISRYLDMAGDELAIKQSDVLALTTEDIAQNEELILSLESVLKLVGVPSQHPLNGLVLKSTVPDDLDKVEGLLKQYSAHLAKMRTMAEQIETLLGINLGMTPRGYRLLAQLCGNLVGIDTLVRPMIEAAYSSRIADVLELVSKGSRLKSMKEQMESFFHRSAMALNATELRLQWRQIGQKWWLPKFFAKRKFLKQLRPYMVSMSFVDIDYPLEQLEQFQSQVAVCNTTWQNELDQAFGRHIDKDSADWEKLREEAFKAKGLIDGMSGQCNMNETAHVVECLKRAADADPHIFGNNQALWKETVNIHASLSNVRQRLDALCQFDQPDSDQLQQMAAAMARHVKSLGRDWKQWTDRRELMRQQQLYVPIECIAQGQNPALVAIAWKKAVYHHQAAHTMATDSRLNAFSGLIFEDTIKQFRKLDQRFQDLTKNELLSRLARRLRENSNNPTLSAALGYLRRNIANHGRGQSVRNIMDNIGDLLPYLCPCMLMSPISVAQYLALDQRPFDLVIFDEASQMPTSEAVGAIARGKALIVVGDPKQMPPTNFFNVNQVDESEEALDDLDSVLDDTIALDFPSRHLRWHYRSRHESLIAFSNSQYYDGRLITFPSVDDRDTKVTFVPVKGVYDYGRSRSNKAEAQAIVDEVLRRLRDKQLCKQSLGIVAFSISQQNLIDDLLMDAFTLNPALEQLATMREEPIFIKNLENVQGDERDVILFSIGYGPDINGKVSMNFGPLNNSGGERRLNVAVSRARYEMMVFSTLMPEQIDLNRSKSLGVQGLKMFLEFARDGRISYQTNTQQPAVNVMARQLAEVLTEHGYQVATSIGRSKFKIDLAVIDSNDPGKYMLGVLCDGKGYSDTKTVRDREVCQPTVLSMLGWNIVRIWMADWFYDRDRVIKQVLDLLKTLEDEAQPPKAKPEKPSPAPVQPTATPPEEPSVDTKPESSATDVVLEDTSGPSATPKEEPLIQQAPLPEAVDVPVVAPEPEVAPPPIAVTPSEKPKPAPTVKPKRKPKSADTPAVKDVIPKNLPDPVEAPYTEASIPVESKGGATALTTHPTKAMAQMKQILQSEQPITFHYACKRMCRIWAIRNINERVERFVTWLLRQTATLDPNAPQAVPYYWADPSLRLTYRNYRLKNFREWHDIPLIEVKNAILALVVRERRISEADMPQLVLELFGIKKCVTLFREQISTALTELVRDNMIIHSDDTYTPVK